jgi:two-component system, LytTR family, sensor kinase
MKKSYLVLMHLAYWGIYFLFLSAIMIAVISNVVSAPHVGEVSLVVYLMGLVPGIGAFYAGYALIFAKFLQQKRIVGTLLVGAAAALVAALLGDLALLIVKGPNILFADGIRSAMEITVFMAAMVGAPNVLLGLGMRAFVSWFEDIQTKQVLEQKNREMEMALIKAQINPHFLFNTIANIDVLIEKDPTKASAYLNKLSGIMRFMLYETQPAQIALARELDYIEQYIALQKIRYSKPENVQFSVTGTPGQQQIAPMLFIPFIENAFKFAEGIKSEALIAISFNISAKEIVFDCKNSYQAAAPASENGGLGNDLIAKRIALLYPGKHQLSHQAANGSYHVQLKIFLA